MLQEVTDETLRAPLHRLGALQAAWWLAASRLRSVAGLFQLLSSAEVTVHVWVLFQRATPTALVCISHLLLALGDP